MTRKMRQLRGEVSPLPLSTSPFDWRASRFAARYRCSRSRSCRVLPIGTWQVAAPAKGASKRDAKTSYTAAIPLRQGDVEEDFEVMANDVQKYAPNLDIDLEIEVAPNKRLRPVEAVRPSVRLDGPPPAGSGKRKRGEFDFKGKARSEVMGARITVWYEEEDKHGRKMDVPYIGIVKSCDPREGLYVQFDSYEDQEMLITNEDDWRWGSHSGGRKPPESRLTR